MTVFGIDGGCFRTFCAACNGSGYDCFDHRQCEFCLGAGDIERCSGSG